MYELIKLYEENTDATVNTHGKGWVVSSWDFEENFDTDNGLIDFLTYNLACMDKLGAEMAEATLSWQKVQHIIGDCNRIVRDSSYIWENHTSLKLHDAYYDSDWICETACEKLGYHYDSENVNTAFYGFCEQEYDLFLDYLAGQNIDFEENIDRIGRTSSFYISPFHGMSELEILDFLEDRLIGGYPVSNLVDEHGILPFTTYGEQWIGIFEDLRTFPDMIRDELEVYRVIADELYQFKKYQIDSFKDYIDCNIDCYFDPVTDDEKKAAFFEQIAIGWSHFSSECDWSYEELFVINSFFEQIGEMYDLIDEFRENAIC